MKFDPHIATITWLISLLTPIVFGPFSVPVIAATTVNLWHQRRTLHNAGWAFEDRVNEVLSARLITFHNQITAMEKSVDDIKDSQVKIAGAFRGRQLPG